MKESNYPITPTNRAVDVVIPYTTTDLHLVGEAVDSILAQRYCLPIIHLVADNCLSIRHPSCINYKTSKQLGPYLIVNLLTNHFRTKHIAIQDADDLSYPDRLWKQVAILEQGYYMTSCAMKQIPSEGYSGKRHIEEPILFPGITQTAAPWGRNINSTRMFDLDMFIKVNGFGNYPMSGDYQFDARVCSIYGDLCHYSNEILADRRLRPLSLSNHPDTGFNTEIRNTLSWRVMDACRLMNNSRTLETCKSLGYLDGVMSLSRQRDLLDVL